MRRLGYMLIIHEDGSITESDLVKCRHCQLAMELKPGTWGQVLKVPEGGGYRDEPACFCAKCYGPICPKCDALRECRPYQRQLEQEEAAARLREALA
jgi:hypothetical protein